MVETVVVQRLDREAVGCGAAFEQALDELDVVADLDAHVGAAKVAEVAAQRGRRADADDVGVAGRVRRDDDRQVDLAGLGGEALHGLDRGLDARAVLAADGGDQQRWMRADAALHDRHLLGGRRVRPLSVVELAPVISTATSSPGAAEPSKFTVTFCRVRPRSVAP